MKTAKETIEFLQLRIGHIFRRPPMYGGNADGVDLILHYYHELLCYILDRSTDLTAAMDNLRETEGLNGHNFPTHFRSLHPEASEIDVTRYVVKSWLRITTLLKIQIPWEQIEEDLKNLGDLSQLGGI